MSGLPFRSKLAPFEQEIVELRRKRPPVSYREIAQLLKERHGVEVTINGSSSSSGPEESGIAERPPERNRQIPMRFLKFLDGRLRLLSLRIVQPAATKEPLVASSSTIPTATPTT
jgi:hypothetical protein